MQNRTGKRKNKAFVARKNSFEEHSLFCEQKENHLHRWNTINKRHFYENNVAILKYEHFHFNSDYSIENYFTKIRKITSRFAKINIFLHINIKNLEVLRVFFCVSLRKNSLIQNLGLIQKKKDSTFVESFFIYILKSIKPLGV